MARPESTRDIELQPVDFGSIMLDKIATDPALLKGYTAFIEAVTKGGATASKTTYSGVEFTRPATQAEALEQLRTAQMRWDEGKKYYETLASVGEVEYNYHRTIAEEWAKTEDMPFPPDVEPISDFHATIAAIDEQIDA
jgi:hypothetical protein